MIQRMQEEPSWLNNTEIVLMPLTNPDGFQYSVTTDRMWRKNRKPTWNPKCPGADLNRNFPIDWNGSKHTSEDPCTEVYIGTAALSEPEAKVLAGLMEEGPLDVHIGVHSYSQMIVCSWEYTEKDPPRKAEVHDLAGKMSRAIQAKHGNAYAACGRMYKASGMSQDYSTKFGALGYTLELRRLGFAPPATSILPTAEELLEGLHAA